MGGFARELASAQAIVKSVLGGKAAGVTYRVALHVSHASAPEDDDFVVVCRKHVGGVVQVDPRGVVDRLVRGLVVALPRDPGLEPGLAVLHGDPGHLDVFEKKPGAAARGGVGAVEPKPGVDGAPCVQAEGIRDVDVAAPRCAAGAPRRGDVRRRAGGGGERPHGRKAEENEPGELHGWALSLLAR